MPDGAVGRVASHRFSVVQRPRRDRVREFLGQVVHGDFHWDHLAAPAGAACKRCEVFGACLAAAAALPRRWLGAALASGFAVTALVYVQAVAAPFPLPAARDPAALQLAGWRDFAQAAAASHPAFLTSDDYATAAALAYYAPRDVPVLGFGPRWQDFAWRMAAPDQPGLLILRGTGETCPDQLGTILRTRRGDTAMSYRVCRFMAPGPGKIFPRP
jgi:hypothetical protein